MQSTPQGNRLHIGIFGRRNVGKSTLINAITNQQIALVSDNPGTTTDPVYKAMELNPIGPVVFIDTAGFDDEGLLGALRVNRTRRVIDRLDIALLLFDPKSDSLDLEQSWNQELKQKKVPVIGVINRIDEAEPEIKQYAKFNIPLVKVSAKKGTNIDKLKKLIIANTPAELDVLKMVGDLIKPKDLVLLVAPQNPQAPKGRLILPQVQAIRDILDHHGLSLIVTDDELVTALELLKDKPDLVITDSQIFKKVDCIIPKDVPLVSFSILLARLKGDFNLFVDGAKAIDELKPGDKILIAEACTHHSLEDDIGRQKIPNWLEERVKGNLDISIKSGVDFPDDLREYKLIIHCGSCMFNRQLVMSRIQKAKEQTVPITNYGIAIAHINGILDRVLTAFNNKKV